MTAFPKASQRRPRAFGPPIVIKAAGEVVPQALPPALTCFLRVLLTLPSAQAAEKIVAIR
jgi:hypothetical protein